MIHNANVYHAGDYVMGQYIVKHRLGNGVSGQVYLVEHKTTSEQLALKVIMYIHAYYINSIQDVLNIRKVNPYINCHQNEIIFNQLLKEVDTDDSYPLCKVKHIYYDVDKRRIVFTMPLYTNVMTTFRFNDTNLSQFAKIIFNIAYGLYFMHNHLHYIHTDIKPDNILCDDKFDEIRISDFGLVINANKEYDYRLNIANIFYRPPERYYEHEWSYPLDIWSLGCTILIMLDHGFYDRIETSNKYSFLYEWGKFMGFIEVTPLNQSVISEIEQIEEYSDVPEELKKYVSQNKMNVAGFISGVRHLTLIKPSKHWFRERYGYRFDPLITTLVEDCLIMDPYKRITAKDIIYSDLICQYYPEGIIKFEQCEQRLS